MQISLLHIRNFRGIKDGQVSFGSRAVLIGPNNSGKTTVIEALALVFGRDRMLKTLTEHDFFGSAPQPTDRIEIIATITGFQSNNPDLYPEWFSTQSGVPKWFDPSSRKISESRSSNIQQLACQIGFCARFDADTLEVETIRYFYDSDDVRDAFSDELVVPVPSRLVRELGLFLIPASRSWERMISFGSELFRRLIIMGGGFPADTVLAEREKLRSPTERLENNPKLKPIIDQVNNEILNLFGVKSGVRLLITATDSDSILDAVVPHFENQNGIVVPSKRQGSGLISLQSLFLLLHFGQKRIEGGMGFIMALEEPEIHLPPSTQRRVLRRLQSLSTQTIVSTHSPLVAGFCEPTELVILRNDDGVLLATPMLEKPLGPSASSDMRRFFQTRRVETAAALMNEVVLVPEGELDCEWLTLLLKVVELEATEINTFGVKVGLVPTPSAKVKETCAILGLAHPLVCALVDGDQPGRAYATNIAAICPPRVRRVLRWPDEWTLEDVIGWIASADEKTVITSLSADLAIPPSDVSSLVCNLKSDDRSVGGLKGDRVSYDAICDAFTKSPNCIARIIEVLEAIASTTTGVGTGRFSETTAGQTPIFTFQP